MNFNLISPDGEGQKFNVKFQEPIVIPPNAKIGLNFAQFERNGHFDFVNPVNISFDSNVDGSSALSNAIFPRMSLTTDTTTPLLSSNTPYTNKLNTNPNIQKTNQTSITFTIPAGTYTFDNLNRTIQSKFFEKGLFLFNNGNEKLFFGDNTPTISQNSCLSLYNGQVLPQNLLPNTLTLGVKNCYCGNTDENEKDMIFSTVHLKDATNTARTSTAPNSYVPSQDKVGDDYESYVLGTQRIIHFNNTASLAFDSIIRRQLNIPVPNPLLNPFSNLEENIYNLLVPPQLSATMRQSAIDNFIGKDFMGFYSIDYAGLSNENHLSFNGGTNGSGFTPSTHNCRKGKNGADAASPADGSVIQGTNLQLGSQSAGFKVPKCFFGVEFDNEGGNNTITIYSSPSMLVGNWRTDAIQDLQVVYSEQLSNLFKLPPSFLDGKLEVQIWWVEETDTDGTLDNPLLDIGTTVVFYPIVGLKRVGKRGTYIVFDGRYNTYPGESDEIGFSCDFLLGTDLVASDLGKTSATTIARRGTDLPLCPIFASTDTDGGWENITGCFYNPQVGTKDSNTDPLRSLHIMRSCRFSMSKSLSQDLFEFTHKNERNEDVINNPITYPTYMRGSSYSFLYKPPINFTGLNFYILVKELPHNYRNDAFNIHINLPIKSFSNTSEKNKSGIRKNILAHCPQIFASNITDDNLVVNGRKIITGGFAPSIGVVQHLDNMGIITTNNFEIELRNMNDDTPANQLFKSIVNFSIFS